MRFVLIAAFHTVVSIVRVYALCMETTFKSILQQQPAVFNENLAVR